MSNNSLRKLLPNCSDVCFSGDKSTDWALWTLSLILSEIASHPIEQNLKGPYTKREVLQEAAKADKRVLVKQL